MNIKLFKKKYRIDDKKLYWFKCRVCGFIRAEFVTKEEKNKGIICSLQSGNPLKCGGIMDLIIDDKNRIKSIPT